MKLPKHNSEPLHVKAMKLKFILPLYFALASVTFCGRKITEEKDSNATLLKETPAITTDSKISGVLELDTATNTIYADLWLKVSSHDFEFAHDFMPLQTRGNYKGIAFRYFDTVKNSPDNGKDTVRIHAVFNFPNDMKWTVDDKVRIMSLDEDQPETFVELKPYFLSRMEYFRNMPCSYEDLVVFNNSWNRDNPNNPVTTAKNQAQKQEKKVVPQKKQQKMIPRLTKDDGILSLKLRR